ncbi:MAG: prepilin-type N-terminal cleavage/methylation domain-containing protein [Gammaproteobacteria bacterium]
MRAQHVLRGALQRGFTLVEVLVAMTMLGLLMAVLFATFATTMRAWERADRLGVEVNDIEAVQRFLRFRLAAARRVSLPENSLPSPGRTQVVFIGERDRLTFVAPLPAQRNLGGLYVYVLHTAGDELRVSYRPFHPRMASLVPDFRSTWATLTLLEDVEQLRIEYLGDPAGQDEADWFPEWPEPRCVPMMLAIELRRTDPRGLPWPRLYARTHAEATRLATR